MHHPYKFAIMDNLKIFNLLQQYLNLVDDGMYPLVHECKATTGSQLFKNAATFSCKLILLNNFFWSLVNVLQVKCNIQNTTYVHHYRKITGNVNYIDRPISYLRMDGHLKINTLTWSSIHEIEAKRRIRNIVDVKHECETV